MGAGGALWHGLGERKAELAQPDEERDAPEGEVRLPSTPQARWLRVGLVQLAR
ncbi:hypothetical protein [Streptomyces sp. NPDC056405]|uniref:hypothetical protein n=1 Tax=Streptomyces sp. NPDC056405 TaxID=3345811 RepID=UPI0035E21209